METQPGIHGLIPKVEEMDPEKTKRTHVYWESQRVGKEKWTLWPIHLPHTRYPFASILVNTIRLALASGMQAELMEPKHMENSGCKMILQFSLPLSQQLEGPLVPGGAATRWRLLHQTMSSADDEVEPPCIRAYMCCAHSMSQK